MEYRKFGDVIAVRLYRGEELVSSLKALCRQEGVTCAQVNGLGACDHVVVGLYNVAQRQYHQTTVDEEMELVSLLGNVTMKDGELYQHYHAAFAAEGGRMVGGHLNEARVSGTAEIFINIVYGSIGRKGDPDTGLNVFDF